MVEQIGLPSIRVMINGRDEIICGVDRIMLFARLETLQRLKSGMGPIGDDCM